MKYYSIGQRKKSRGNLTWYGRTFENGILIKEESLRTKRKSDAQEWLNAMNALRFMPDNLRARLDPVDRPLSEAYATFMSYVEAKNSFGTFRNYSTKMKIFLTWCSLNSVSTLRDFSPEKSVQFINSVSAVNGVSTVCDYIVLMRHFTSWCNDTYDMTDYNPMKSVKMPKKVKRSKSFWTPEQIDMILDKAPDDGIRFFWALMAFAGLRRSEALAMGRTTTIDGERIRVIGKGSKESFIPISDRLKSEIDRVKDPYKAFSANYFHYYDGPSIRLKEAVKSAGLDVSGASDHKFRHSFISNVYRTKKVNELELQQLARHSSITTTLGTYAHLLEEDLKEAVNAKKED